MKRQFTYLCRCMALVLTGLLLATAGQAVNDEVHDLVPAQEEISHTLTDDAWKTLLVNPWNALPENFQVDLVSLKNGLQVDKRIYDDLNAMLIDCRAAGLQPIVCSAYRDYAYQNRLYQNKIARLCAAGYDQVTAQKEAGRWVAIPGTSEHQTGLALDIVSRDYQLLDEKQADTAEQQWFMEHSWKYGFILRYPENKTEITGIGYEPWHYRYVGREAAAVIYESGQCLEEYLNSIEDLKEAVLPPLLNCLIPT